MVVAWGRYGTLVHYRAKTDIGYLPALEEKKKGLVVRILLSHKIAVCSSAFSLTFSVSSLP